MPANQTPQPTPGSNPKKAAEAKTVSGEETTSRSAVDALLSKVQTEMREFPLDAMQKVFDLQHKMLFVAYESAKGAGFSDEQAMELAEKRMEKMLEAKR